MGEAHGSEAETAVSRCQTAIWGRPCVAGEALHPTRSADGRVAPGVLVAPTRGRFVFLPVTGPVQ